MNARSSHEDGAVVPERSSTGFWLDMATQWYGKNAIGHECLVRGVFIVEYFVGGCLCYLRILAVIWIILSYPFKSQRSLNLGIYHHGLLTYLLTL